MSRAEVDLSSPLTDWLVESLEDPGPFTLRPLVGGNSNETLLLSSPAADRVMRRPPEAALAVSAHSMAREVKLLTALACAPVPTPAPLAYCEDPSVDPRPFFVMEHVAGVSLTVGLPSAYPAGPETVRSIGEETIDALALLHSVDWEAAGLEDFGSPDGFLERQVPRWRSQYDTYAVRDLPDMEVVSSWLAENRPADFEPGILHGDFRVDNCLFCTTPPPSLLAIIDWEMATVGDPLLDLGLFLAFWGTERPERPGFPKLQAFSRIAGAPSRSELARRYSDATGRSVEHVDWYMSFALWKLAAIVESAYANHVRGRATSDYARGLEQDVPRLFAEAAAIAGVSG